MKVEGNILRWWWAKDHFKTNTRVSLNNSWHTNYGEIHQECNVDLRSTENLFISRKDVKLSPWFAQPSTPAASVISPNMELKTLRIYFATLDACQKYWGSSIDQKPLKKQSGQIELGLTLQAARVTRMQKNKYSLFSTRALQSDFLLLHIMQCDDSFEFWVQLFFEQNHFGWFNSE